MFTGTDIILLLSVTTSRMTYVNDIELRTVRY